MKASTFAQYLINQQPKYDALVLKDIQPEDCWKGAMMWGMSRKEERERRQWIKRLERQKLMLEKLISWIGKDLPVEMERFLDVYPDTKAKWKKLSKKEKAMNLKPLKKLARKRVKRK